MRIIFFTYIQQLLCACILNLYNAHSIDFTKAAPCFAWDVVLECKSHLNFVRRVEKKTKKQIEMFGKV